MMDAQILSNLYPAFTSLSPQTYLGLFATGCGTTAQAGVTPLGIGLAVDDNNPNASAANDNFRLALEAHIGMPVIIIEDVTYLVARDVVDVALIASLREFFLTYDDADFFYHGWNDADLRFTPADHQAFENVVNLTQTLGLNFGG